MHEHLRMRFLAAAGVLAVLTMAPGPDTAVVTKRSVACGWRDGPRTVGGITAGLLTRGALTVVGPAALLAASATACTVVEPVGAVHPAFLGVQALLHGRRDRSGTPGPVRRAPKGARGGRVS